MRKKKNIYINMYEKIITKYKYEKKKKKLI